MNQSEYKIHNLEASILYIQEEHARILKLLHEEIKDLQMKNSELSFNMAMREVALPQESREPEDYQNLLDQIKSLQSEVSRITSENNDKVQEIDSQEIKIRLLKGTIDKLKEFQRAQMSAVELELNNKSAEIVLLSTKLHNWKRLEVNRPSVLGDETMSPRSSCKPLLGPPATGVSVFKLRNQISVHPDDGHLKNRPTVARHTLISASYPVKTSTVHMNPECAVSREERINFSKLIRRPNILPPINSIKHNLQLPDIGGRKIPKTTALDSSQGSRESSIDSIPIGMGAIRPAPSRGESGHDYECLVSSLVDTDDTNNHNNHVAMEIDAERYNWLVTEQQKQPSRVQVDIDRVMDMTAPSAGGGGPSHSIATTPPIRCSANHRHPSSSSSPF